MKKRKAALAELTAAKKAAKRVRREPTESDEDRPVTSDEDTSDEDKDTDTEGSSSTNDKDGRARDNEE